MQRFANLIVFTILDRVGLIFLYNKENKIYTTDFVEEAGDAKTIEAVKDDQEP